MQPPSSLIHCLLNLPHSLGFPLSPLLLSLCPLFWSPWTSSCWYALGCRQWTSYSCQHAEADVPGPSSSGFPPTLQACVSTCRWRGMPCPAHPACSPTKHLLPLAGCGSACCLPSLCSVLEGTLHKGDLVFAAVAALPGRLHVLGCIIQ